jgi:hypothetical protein
MPQEDINALFLLYISEYWSLFEGWCEQRGEDAQAIYEAIGGEPE